MMDDEGWPRGTIGQLDPVRAALVTGAALAMIALVVVAACVAVLLMLRAVA